MIEAITDCYKQFIEETFQKNSSTAISLISKARDDLNKELGGSRRSTWSCAARPRR